MSAPDHRYAARSAGRTVDVVDLDGPEGFEAVHRLTLTQAWRRAKEHAGWRGELGEAPLTASGGTK